MAVVLSEGMRCMDLPAAGCFAVLSASNGAGCHDAHAWSYCTDAVQKKTEGRRARQWRVHAGIGRSGALCTVAVAIKRLRAVDPRDGAAARQAVNVKRIVGALRRQRAGMVQTYEQYLLCYQVGCWLLHAESAWHLLDTSGPAA